MQLKEFSFNVYLFQIVNWLCSHCHSNNYYCLSNAKGCYNLKSCHSKIQPVAMKIIHNWIKTLLFLQRMRQKWKLWHVWLHSFCCHFKSQFLFMMSQMIELTIYWLSFQICQNDSKVHFFKDIYVKKKDFLKLKILYQWQLSILKDKNVCQSSKYYRNNILNCLWNT